MKITSKKYAQSLAEAAWDQPKQQIDKLTYQFVNLLVKKNALSMGRQIINELVKIQDVMHQRVEVTLVTVKPLTSDQLTLIISLLKKKLTKQIRLVNLTDPAILGGSTISFLDNYLDASIKKQLIEMKQKLMNT